MAGWPAAEHCLFAEVCIHRLSCLAHPPFILPVGSTVSQNSPPLPPSATSASAPPLLGTAFCLSGSLGSRGVCNDHNIRAYITLFFILQTLCRQSLSKASSGRPRVDERLSPRQIGQSRDRGGGQRGGPGGSGARAAGLSSPAGSEERGSHASRPPTEKGNPTATLSLLLCTLSVPRAGSREGLKAPSVSMCVF